MGGVNWYGLMVGLGVVAGAVVADRMRRSWGMKPSVWDVLAWVVVPGVIGARLYHVADWWWYYQDHLDLIAAVWTGGLGIYGGLLGGVLGLAVWCRRRQQSIGKWLDVVAVGLPLGQAIGRWGNYFNQELYGKLTKLPWAIYIEAEKNYFHPLFAYESVWNLLVFAVVSLRLRSGPAGRPGNVFVLYLGLYSLGRFWLEWLRIEAWRVAGVNVAQAISLAVGVLSWIWLWKRNWRGLGFS